MVLVLLAIGAQVLCSKKARRYREAKMAEDAGRALEENQLRAMKEGGDGTSNNIYAPPPAYI